MRIALVIGLTAALGALVGACASSDVSREVGARCDGANDCDGQCLGPGADYPGGFCTISCNARADCPSDTTCADREGGVCLFTCTNDQSCAFLGAGWRCTTAELRGGGIEVMVCRGD
jgi:hypothetical protein